MKSPLVTATWLLGLFGRKSDGEHDAHGVASHAGSDQHSASAGGVAVSPNVQGLASSHYDPTGFSQLIVSTEGGLAADEHTNRQGLENEHNSDASGQWSGYIARPADGGHAWRQAFKQAADMVSQMTLEEKVNLTTAVWGPCPSNSGGVPRLNISGMCFDDGPAGPRYTDFVTQFPSAFTAAASFDRDLIMERAQRIGREFRGKGINVALAPVTGGPLGRSPFAGRNWEAFSPDPYLSSTLSYITVRGMQESGLITCAKHYVLYEQEPVCTGPVVDGMRTDCHHVNSIVDDKTMKELYLPSFVESVRAGTGAVMCSYNLINGTQSCENDQSMNRILKDELGFQGFILSDYGATHSTTPSVMAGLDMELPGEYWYGARLLKALHDKEIPISRLDDMARRILTPQLAQKQNRDYPHTNFHSRDLADERHEGDRVLLNEHVDVRGDNPDFARKVAAESTVLLKNSGILPLRGVRRIGIFGSDADYPSTLTGCGPDLFCTLASKRIYWNGTVTIGGGSGAAYADYIVPPLEGIAKVAREQRIRLDWVLHDDATHHDQMYHVARQSEVCLVFVSVYLVETWDREGGNKALRSDKDGEEMIKRVESACGGEVIVVLHIGGQVIVEDWVDLPRIGAVLFAGYPGQESGHAIADVLFGRVNPSGKLMFTMGKQVSDWPTGNILRDMSADDISVAASSRQDPVHGQAAVHAPRSVFSEGLAIDYKWFDKWNIQPRWEFGFGLSYTSFDISDMNVTKVHLKDTAAVQETNERYEGTIGLYDAIYEVSVNATNTGALAGAQVVQLYLSYPASEVDQPPKHLRGFAKVMLDPGQSKTAVMQLRKKDLAIWDVIKQVWRVPTGRFTLHVGSSSRDLPLTHDLSVSEHGA